MKHKITYWCVPNRESGYNKRFATLREAKLFYKEQTDPDYSKPAKVEIEYYNTLDLVDICLAGESPVNEPDFDEAEAFDREVDEIYKL